MVFSTNWSIRTKSALITFLHGSFHFMPFRYDRFQVKPREFDAITRLISDHLSEPYSIYVYWYFLNTWPQYCFVVRSTQTPASNDDDDDDIIGVIISKVEPHRDVRMRGYIGMLVIEPEFRGQGIASELVRRSINAMITQDDVDEVMLETEVINDGALRLYESMGFMRTKRLYRYYLNTHDAFRLVLPLHEKSGTRIAFLPPL